MTINTSLLVIVALFTVSPVNAATRFILPIGASNLSGSFNSRWMTQALLFNGSSERVTTVPAPAPCPTGDCFEPFDPLTTRYYYLLPANGAVHGLIVSVPDAQAPFISMTERSWGGDYLPTDVPVVREDQMFTSDLHLLRIPDTSFSSGRFRVTVRIYALPESGAPSFDVRLLSFEGETAATRRVQLAAAPNPYQPAELTITDPHQYFSLPDRPGLDYTIEIRPTVGPVRFYAFATVTDNSTQRFDVILPR